MKAKEIWLKGRVRESRNPFSTKRKLYIVLLFHFLLVVATGYAIHIHLYSTIVILIIAIIIFIIGNYLLAE